MISVRHFSGRPPLSSLTGLTPDWATTRSCNLAIPKDLGRRSYSKMGEPIGPAPSSSSIADFHKRPLSGLFAINKPSGTISMTLLESLKELFLSSQLFVDNPEPFQIEKTTGVKKSRKNKYWQKKNQAKAIKIGQGGTLDPLASGVLIIGLNSATKKLSNFLDCSKAYRTTGILGCKTDSYDSDGKTVGLAAWKHVKPEDIRRECGLIKGEHWQIPPIYSALKMDGKPLYEYARNNIPLPRAIEARRCEISEIRMVEWKEADEHAYKWPTKMMSEEDSKIFQRAEHLVQQTGVVKGNNSSSLVVPPKQEAQEETNITLNESSKRELPLEQEAEKESKKIKLEEVKEIKKGESDQPNDPTTPKLEEGSDPKRVKPEDGSSQVDDAQSSTNDPPTGQENTDGVTMEDNGKSPVFTLEMTVSSGTYVRTIVHDIGQAVSSAATVVSLIRTRQGDFCLDPPPKDPHGDDSKSLGCIEWSVFENAIQARSSGSDYPVDQAGFREWERELLKHIQV
ncbi:hypothetical protein PGTUg99_023294 [Puccinia graminis f. sp. tritici]|uniref:tRNA pseudouridine(55) synthase n=1 Tax=Puccinia graminis f. sp. tritici TaxID=56615 RepID=A0A5B0QLU4_PUCGR|nr:hypothetical protein PGTUg99_023294 [Puccinia graminis f. sp. tritici]